ncbi:response regulator [bacterium]|nr:response regulator [bacterium]
MMDSGSSGKSGRIMLVDDSLPFLRNFGSILQGKGYEVRTVESGMAAIEILEAFQPQLVSLDYDMPGLDGLGTLLQVKQKLPEAKVIFISGRMDLDAVTQVISNGASECVTKPVDLQRLLTIVDKLIENAGY